uniref:ATP synthase mitochondrial F1 complex assembly factor-like protein n=1 Tax=Hydractinia symbiolongicarpus TaxID=13093 RepID=C0ILU2_HYDSY|nr:ATP synthase mitochondrial F1 complex assembly factor-like protein [Hydractinia symbiolongicarpus]
MNNYFRKRFLSVVVNQRMMSYLKANKIRFYKNVDIHPDKNGYLIQLDNRTIKTPLLNQLCVPTKRLAVAVANEWFMQTEVIDQHNMPLTAICNTAIDNPTNITQEELVDEILNFFHTDTICALTEEPEALMWLQKEKWTPIHEWFSKKFNVEVNASSDLFGLYQPDHTISTMKNFLMKLNRWQLCGVQAAVDSIKSFILPLCVIKKHISIEEALYLSRLELEFQIEKWGNVEYAHDIDRYNQQSLLTTAVLVFHLSQSTLVEDLP